MLEYVQIWLRLSIVICFQYSNFTLFDVHEIVITRCLFNCVFHM